MDWSEACDKCAKDRDLVTLTVGDHTWEVCKECELRCGEYLRDFF